uniref:Uncharacterized protein n=1 Tax=Glossina brevipalpis TaxID=37001 RepID=A0A1A9WCE4_9MUSC
MKPHTCAFLSRRLGRRLDRRFRCGCRCRFRCRCRQRYRHLLLLDASYKAAAAAAAAATTTATAAALFMLVCLSACSLASSPKLTNASSSWCPFIRLLSSQQCT